MTSKFLSYFKKTWRESKVIFKESWQIYKQNYKLFLRILIPLLILAVLLTILNIFDFTTNLKFANFSIPIYLFLSAASFVVGLWTQIVLIRLIWNSIVHQSIEEKSLKQEGWRDIVPFLWVNILTGLIILGGTILFIIPGLIFSIWYYFASYIFAVEKIHGYGALKASKDLSQGRFWIVVGKIVLISLMYLAIMLIIIGAPTLIIIAATKFTNIVNLSNQWWFEALQTFAAFLTLPLNLGFWTILYKNLKENKAEIKPTV